MKEEGIDFSVLDPSRDPRRWEHMVASVTARAVAARRPRASLTRQVTAWAYPALAVAAAAAVASWTGALATARDDSEVTRETEPPAFVLARWATADARPSTPMILQVLGGQDDRD